MLEVLIDIDGVGSAHLVDAHGNDIADGALFFSHWPERGHERQLRIIGHTDDGVGGHEFLFISIANGGLQQSSPIEIARGVARVVNLHSHYVVAFMKQRGGQLNVTLKGCVTGVCL